MSGRPSPLHEAFEKARVLIKAQKYTEARALLQKIDHPKAAEWIEQINLRDPGYDPFAASAAQTAQQTASVEQGTTMRSKPGSVSTSGGRGKRDPIMMALVGMVVLLMVILAGLGALSYTRLLTRHFENAVLQLDLPDMWFVTASVGEPACPDGLDSGYQRTCLIAVERIDPLYYAPGGLNLPSYWMGTRYFHPSLGSPAARATEGIWFIRIYVPDMDDMRRARIMTPINDEAQLADMFSDAYDRITFQSTFTRLIDGVPTQGTQFRAHYRDQQADWDVMHQTMRFIRDPFVYVLDVTVVPPEDMGAYQPGIDQILNSIHFVQTG